MPEIWTQQRKFSHEPVFVGTENCHRGEQIRIENFELNPFEHGQEDKMDLTSTNRELVKRHFEAVNRREVQTVLGNMRPDLYDHELEGDHGNDLQEGAQRLQALMKQVPDLTVYVRDTIADGDKVVVRAVWSGTNAVNQRKVEFHGFVQWRIVDGKFAERWATVTPIVEIPEGTNVW